MDLKKVVAVLAVLLIISLFITYWYLPSDSRNYIVLKSSPNQENTTMATEIKQFYPNMRFSSSNISYDIDSSCNLKKQNDIEDAFKILEDKTPLKFYSSYDGKIKVTCDDKSQMEGGLLIAGEGGPTQVSIGKYFSIIGGGRILLIRESSCPEPNLDIHELLHVLGFDHSQNSSSILYSVLSCDQQIDQGYIDEINRLYSYPSLPDLEIENFTASMSKRFLNYNLTVQNEGLADAGVSYLDVYADDKRIDEIIIDPLKIGYGERLSMANFMVSKISFNSIKFVIRTDEQELNLNNNQAILEIKK